MSRILLADCSPHAQRMGELILREEGFEVVTVTDGETAVVRLEDFDPDVILADVAMPSRSGYQICEFVKSNPRYSHARVVLTAGAMDPVDPERAKAVRADGVIQKPFEAAALLETVKPLAEWSQAARGVSRASKPNGPSQNRKSPIVAVLDAEQVQAAVTLALDGAMAELVDVITQRVITALAQRGTPLQQPPSNGR